MQSRVLKYKDMYVYLIGMRKLLEFLYVSALVRVILDGKLPVRFLDLGFTCIPARHSQHGPSVYENQGQTSLAHLDNDDPHFSTPSSV